MKYLQEHIKRWEAKKNESKKKKTAAWDYNLDASGGPLYDHEGKLNKNKRQGVFHIKKRWDPFK